MTVADLRGELVLETRDAEREIERLGPLFDRVVDRFSVELAKALDQLTSIPPPDIDLRQVDAAISESADNAGQLLSVALEEGASGAADPIAEAVSSGLADSGEQLAFALESGAESSAPTITDAISGAVADADTTVEIDADTSAAEAELDGLATKAEEAGSSLGDLGGAAKGAGALGAAASGSFAGLGSAVGELPKRTAGAIGAITAVGGSLALFFNEAVQAAGATVRLDQSMGDLASRIERIKVGSLDTDLSKLALTLGSDDDNMRNVAASAFEIATAFGKGRDESADFSAGLLAVASRAVALNPKLGDAGDAAQNLLRALQSGRERALIPFQLGLSQAAINAKAMQIALADGRSELNASDRAFAGITLATEKFGRSLKDDIAKGVENPIIKLGRLKQTVIENVEALGTPLIAPVFELLEQAIPVAETAGRVLTTLARATLPTFIATLRAVNPLLALLADILERIPAPVLTAILAFLAFRGPLRTASGALNLFGNAGLTAMDKLGRLAVALGLAVSSFDQIGKSAGQSALGLAGMAASGALIGSTFGQPAIGAAVGVVVGLGKVLLSGGESAEEFRKRVKGLASELEGLSEKQATVRFLQSIDAALKLVGRGGQNTLGIFRREIEEIGRTSPAAAQRVVAGLRAMGAESGLTSAQIDKLQVAVDKSSAAFARNAAKKGEATGINQALATSEAAAAEAAKKAAEDAEAAWQSYVDTLVANQPTITSLFDTAIKVAQDFADKNKAALDPNVIIDQLAKQSAGVQTFSENVNRFLSEGLDDLAALVLQKGPEAGGAVAQAFADATPETRRRAEEQLEAAAKVIDALADQIAGPLAEKLAKSALAAGFGTGVGMALGIRNSRALAIAEAEATARAIEQTFLHELGISSPSKVAIAIGEEVGHGLAVGMDRSIERFVGPAGQRLAMRPMQDLRGATTTSSSVTTIDNSFHADGWKVGGENASEAAFTAQRRMRAASFFRRAS